MGNLVRFFVVHLREIRAVPRVLCHAFSMDGCEIKNPEV